MIARRSWAVFVELNVAAPSLIQPSSHCLSALHDHTGPLSSLSSSIGSDKPFYFRKPMEWLFLALQIYKSNPALRCSECFRSLTMLVLPLSLTSLPALWAYCMLHDPFVKHPYSDFFFASHARYSVDNANHIPANFLSCLLILWFLSFQVQYQSLNHWPPPITWGSRTCRASHSAEQRPS